MAPSAVDGTQVAVMNDLMMSASVGLMEAEGEREAEGLTLTLTLREADWLALIDADREGLRLADTD